MKFKVRIDLKAITPLTDKVIKFTSATIKDCTKCGLGWESYPTVKSDSKSLVQEEISNVAPVPG